jgi:hypothetical protein
MHLHIEQKKRMTNHTPVSKNAHPSFAATMDDEDRFHILWQDLQGNLHYTLVDENDIKSTPVLSSRIPTAYNKHLRIFPINEDIHLLYVLKQEKSPILSHQILSLSKVGTPKVVDYVFDNSCPVSAVFDGDNSLYAFYQSSDGKYLQLGYKKYHTSHKYWSEFTPVSNHMGDCAYPRL